MSIATALRARRVQVDTQELTATLAYEAIRRNVFTETPPTDGTIARALYDEHLDGIRRGDLKPIVALTPRFP